MAQNSESQAYLEKFNQSLKKTRESILSKPSPKRPFIQWLKTSHIAFETIKDYAAHKNTQQNELISRLNALISNYTELENYINSLDLATFQDLVQSLFTLIQEEMNSLQSRTS